MKLTCAAVSFNFWEFSSYINRDRPSYIIMGRWKREKWVREELKTKYNFFQCNQLGKASRRGWRDGLPAIEVETQGQRVLRVLKQPHAANLPD